MKARSKEKEKEHVISRELLFVLIGIVCIVLIVCSFVMLQEYSDELEDQASVKALLYTTDTAAYLKDEIESYKTLTEVAAQKLASATVEDNESFITEARLLTIEDDRFSKALYVRYFKDGSEYNSNGTLYNKSQEAPFVLSAVQRNVATFAGYIVDRQYNYNVVAFCAPIFGSEYADSLVMYFSMDDVSGFDVNANDEFLQGSRMTLMCSTEGEVVKVLHNADIEITNHNNIYDTLRGLINDKMTIDDMRASASSNKNSVYSVKIGGESHVISVASVGESGASLSILGVYKCTDIYSSGYSTVNTILGTLIVFFILMIFVAIFVIVSSRRTKKRILTMNDTNKRLGCDTRVKFERDAAEILARNKSTNFAVVVIEMKHFNYISDNYDDDTVTKVLLFLKMIYSKMLQLDETYAHMGDSRFVLLLHYRDEEMLMKRLITACNLARNYKGKFPSSYHIDLCGGIYETPIGLTDNVSKMIDLAVEAKNAVSNISVQDQFHVYSEKMQQSHIQDEYIEVHMNSALENKQFIVFYQPKYNIANDRPDGCEALVRWYNPDKDEYMKPAVFMPLFEANGFIVKLDKYVYEQVCCYMEEAVAQGQPLYPVSVNISRLTATQPDFVDYYVSRKKAHNIADGFIMLEFTESFAYEGYETLRNTINKLHENGFKCSIDDFGTGFSSYNILKELPMDEIKLDRFFMERGISEERDVKILSSVISVARSLGMKVTQEGVETIDQLQLLTKLGCHVIQGYHYAKPLYITDYITFITDAQHGSFRNI